MTQYGRVLPKERYVDILSGEEVDWTWASLELLSNPGPLHMEQELSEIPPMEHRWQKNLTALSLVLLKVSERYFVNFPFGVFEVHAFFRVCNSFSIEWRAGRHIK